MLGTGVTGNKYKRNRVRRGAWRKGTGRKEEGRLLGHFDLEVSTDSDNGENFQRALEWLKIY